MAYKKPKKNLSRGYRSTNNQVIEGYTGGEGGAHPTYNSNKKTLLFGYFATNKNSKVPEGWKGGQGPVIPPPYTGPKSSFTRAYYSPNTEAYELGWRGGYGFQQHIDYFKNAIALATIFVTNKSGVNRPKQAVSTTVNLARSTNGFLHVKFAIALQTSAIVSRYIRSKIKTAIVNYVGVIKNSKQFTGVRRVTANSIGYAKVAKTTRHFRVSVVNLVNLTFEGRIDKFFKKAIAAYTQSVIIAKRSRFTRTAKALQTSLASSLKPLDKYYRSAIATSTRLINSTKIFNRFRKSTTTSINIANSYKTIKRVKQALAESTFLIRNIKSYNNFKKAFATRVLLIESNKTRVALIKTVFINIANYKQLSRFKRAAKALTTNIAFDGKISAFHRYGTARITYLITTTKKSKFIRVAQAIQANLAIGYKIASHKRVSIVNGVSIIKSSRTYGAKVRSTVINIANTSKVGRFVRTSSAIVVDITGAYRINKFFRSANAIVINIALDRKIDRFYRFAVARTTNLISTTKKSKFIRAAKANQLSVAISTRFVVAKRLAQANQVMLSKVSKNYGKNIKVVLVELAKTTKIVKFARQAKATIINIAVITKKSKFIRFAKATAINIVSDSKIDQFYRYAVARVSNLAQTIKLSKFTRKANVNRINLARTNKRRATSIKALSTNLSANTKSHAYRKIAKNTTIFIGNILAGGKNNKKSVIVLQSVSATVTKANNRKKYATATVSYEIGTKKSITFFRRAIATAVSLVRYGISMVINVRSIESAKVEPFNEVNFYVTPNNVDIAGDHATENDQTAPYSEPLYNSGEDVVPS
jgi:hypothetical protein